MCHIFNCTIRMVWWLVLGSLITGCAMSHTESDYIPSDETAEKALETALTAWQNGKSPGVLEGTSPPVQVVDAQWQAGEKLKSFQILGEDEAEGAPRWFSVQLTLASGKEHTVHYVLVGKESIWVYRDDDFARATGMQANPPLKRKR